LPQSIVHLTKAPKSLKDLTGERIVGPTQLTALGAQHMGAQPITLPSPEAYEAMNRGTADGTILSWNVYFSFKIGEVAHYRRRQRKPWIAIRARRRAALGANGRMATTTTTARPPRQIRSRRS
jgi:hypothetical protein